MAASINDKFRKTAPIFSTTLAAQKAASASTMSLSSATGVPTDTAVDFTVGRVDSAGTRTPSAKAVYKGTVSGTTVSNLTLVEGTDQLHAAGTPVEITWTSKTWTDAVDGILVEHKQTGAHSDVTADSISVANNIDLVDGKAIRDGNDNELIKVSQTTSAVNEVTVKNAATGNPPEIQATGDDTNIDLKLVPKGTGEVTKNGNPIDWWEEIGRTTLGSAGDTITVSSLPARKYLRILVSVIATGGTIDGSFQFNGDTGSNYTRRVSVSGAADAGATSQTSTSILQTATACPAFGEFLIVNISAQEKLMTGHSISQQTAGAGTNVERREHAYKWSNTSAQISSITLTNGGTGNFAIGSEIVVLGHD